MRKRVLIALLSVPAFGQSQPACTGITLEVDARCGCVRDPNGQLCEMVKRGFYEPHDPSKATLWGTQKTTVEPYLSPAPPAAARRSATPRATAPARPRQARVVPLTHKDYLRFLAPNARLAAGFDLSGAFQSPELMAQVFGEGSGMTDQMAAGIKEIDHCWISFSPPSDVLLLMTGTFEKGAMASMFYAQGVYPVFLTDAHAMLIGPEPSIQAALARLAKPAAGGGWVATRARELAKEHQTWVVSQLATDAAPGGTDLPGVRQFALGFRTGAAASVDGDLMADSEAGAEKLAAWLRQMKAAMRGTPGAGALDTLTVERSGNSLKFAAREDGVTDQDSRAAMQSELGAELYNTIMAGLPGAVRAVAAEKLSAVKAGMHREDLLKLLGPPVSVSSIQGLDTPRETWTYQQAFGPQMTVRLDAGIVSAPPQ